MEMAQMSEQLLAFQRRTFDNWCNLMGLMDEQSNSALQLISGELRLLPEQGREAMGRWLGACRKERMRFQELMHHSFDVAAGLVKKPETPPRAA
jgi:hypothetical protein